MTTLDFGPETGDATAEFAVFRPGAGRLAARRDRHRTDAMGTLTGDGRCP